MDEEEILRTIAEAATICAAVGQLIQRMEAETSDPGDPIYMAQLYFFRSVYKKYRKIQLSEKVYKDIEGNFHLRSRRQFNVN